MKNPFPIGPDRKHGPELDFSGPQGRIRAPGDSIPWRWTPVRRAAFRHHLYRETAQPARRLCQRSRRMVARANQVAAADAWLTAQKPTAATAPELQQNQAVRAHVRWNQPNILWNLSAASCTSRYRRKPGSPLLRFPRWLLARRYFRTFGRPKWPPNSASESRSTEPAMLTTVSSFGSKARMATPVTFLFSVRR